VFLRVRWDEASPVVDRRASTVVRADDADPESCTCRDWTGTTTFRGTAMLDSSGRASSVTRCHWRKSWQVVVRCRWWSWSGRRRAVRASTGAVAMVGGREGNHPVASEVFASEPSSWRSLGEPDV